MIPHIYGPATILGQLASKSNSRKLVHFGGRPAFIKSQKARNFVEGFLLQAKPPRKTIEGPLMLTAYIYYDSRRPDLDHHVLQDCLQNAGIIQNDRQIFAYYCEKRLDRENPRVVFWLDRFGSQEQDVPVSE